jgi:hypothetical protein
MELIEFSWQFLGTSWHWRSWDDRKLGKVYVNRYKIKVEYASLYPLIASNY